MISAKEFFGEAEEDLEEDDLLKDRVHNGHKPVNEADCDGEECDEDEAITDEDFFMPVDETEDEDSEEDEDSKKNEDKEGSNKED